MVKYTVVVERDEDDWLVSEVLELPGCHTQAKSYDELMKRTKEAIQAYTSTEKTPVKTDSFVGVQLLEV